MDYKLPLSLEIMAPKKLCENTISLVGTKLNSVIRRQEFWNVHVRCASFKGHKLKEKGPNHKYSMGVTSSIPQENGF